MKESFYRIIRSHVIFALRRFFQQQSFIELETPSLSPVLIPERHIAVYKTHDQQGDKYLVPSPEIHIKPILAQLAAEVLDKEWKVYEFAHSFRKDEEQDAIHSNEFTMLECYDTSLSIEKSIEFCVSLLKTAVDAAIESGGSPPSWMRSLSEKNYNVITMAEAFSTYAQVNLTALVETKTIEEAKKIAGIPLNKSTTYDWEDVFHHIFAEKIEPALPKDACVFITHYPHRIPTLAASYKNSPWAQRWELYAGVIELANCYYEETNPSHIEKFFTDQKCQQDYTSKGIRSPNIPAPEKYLQNPPLPPCSGIALGVDRLIMLLCKEKKI